VAAFADGEVRADSELVKNRRELLIGMNVGLTASQLRQLTQVLADRVDADYARRAREALERQLGTKAGS
jgi:hypothetical protein